MIAGAERLILEHGGRRFTAYAMGQGPLVLLLHGFPDTPATFTAQLPALAAAGYRAIAVTLRGYEPSSLPADGSCYVRDLAEDVVRHLDALGATRAHLVGHDWGASIGYAAVTLAPERFASFTALAVPHPALFAQGLATDALQLERIAYITHLVSRPDVAREIVADGGAWLRERWSRWSPQWAFTDEDFAPVVAAFGPPGVADAAVRYYVQALDATSPRGAASVALYAQPIRVPTLALCGETDGCIGAAFFTRVMTPTFFPGGLTVERLGHVGHFLHREDSAAVNVRMTEFLADHPAA